MKKGCSVLSSCLIDDFCSSFLLWLCMCFLFVSFFLYLRCCCLWCCWCFSKKTNIVLTWLYQNVLDVVYWIQNQWTALRHQSCKSRSMCKRPSKQWSKTNSWHVHKAVLSHPSLHVLKTVWWIKSSDSILMYSGLVAFRRGWSFVDKVSTISRNRRCFWSG